MTFQRPTCKLCGAWFRNEKNLDRHGPRCPALSWGPIVYRFICPDGRSYVGGIRDSYKRDARGIGRLNSWLIAAFEQHPPETWTFEVLQRLRPGCSTETLRRVEQRHIDRLRSWDPACGLNMNPAAWGEAGPEQMAMVRQRYQEMNRRVRERQKGWREAYGCGNA